MKPEKTTVMVLPIDGEAYFRTVDNNLAAHQSIVNGPIQYIHFDVEGVAYDFWCNEDGLILDLPRNPLFHQYRGNLYISKSNADGETITLNDDDQDRLQRFIMNLEPSK